MLDDIEGCVKALSCRGWLQEKGYVQTVFNELAGVMLFINSFLFRMDLRAVAYYQQEIGACVRQFVTLISPQSYCDNYLDSCNDFSMD